MKASSFVLCLVTVMFSGKMATMFDTGFLGLAVSIIAGLAVCGVAIKVNQDTMGTTLTLFAACVLIGGAVIFDLATPSVSTFAAADPSAFSSALSLWVAAVFGSIYLYLEQHHPSSDSQPATVSNGDKPTA